MALEVATWLESLVVSNPPSTDFLRQADDHIRLIKSTLKNTFPNLTRAQYLEQARADLASASAPDLSTVASGYINITGSTTITTFATEPSGFTRRLRFAGAPLLVFDGTALILPGNRDIQVVAEDHCTVVSTGGGWRVIDYHRSDGGPTVAYQGRVVREGSHSGGSTMDLTLAPYASSAFRSIKIALTDVSVSTDAANFNLFTSTDGGSTFATAAGSYSWVLQTVTAHVSALDDFLFSASDTLIRLTPQSIDDGGISNAATNGATITLELFSPENTTQWKTMEWESTHMHAPTDTIRQLFGSGWRRATANVDALRFQTSSGNFACDFAIIGMA